MCFGQSTQISHIRLGILQRCEFANIEQTESLLLVAHDGAVPAFAQVEVDDTTLLWIGVETLQH